MTACRLIIADDHPLFRDALRLTVALTLPDAEIVEAGSFESLKGALETYPDADLVLLDLNMPGMQGLSGPAFPAAPPSPPCRSRSSRATRSRASSVRRSIGFAPPAISRSRPRAGRDPRRPRRFPGGRDVAARRPRAGPARPADADAALAARLARLTPQQVRVLMMLNDGLLNKQIAHALGVSEGDGQGACLRDPGEAERRQPHPGCDPGGATAA